jgi:hypothetical protein
MQSRNSPNRPDVANSNPPFALCVNGVPIARVPYDTAIDHAAATMEQIRCTVPRSSGKFSVGLCRLESKAMGDLPAAHPSLMAEVVAKFIKRQTKGESR